MSARRTTLPGPRPRIARRRSAISGWGVYALGPIRKNTRIIDYAGERISHRESDRRERAHLTNGRVWCFALDHRVVIDASVGGNVARFVNHSCRPNCYSRVVDGAIWICAGRNLARGEELTYRYYTEGAAGITCRCRPGCETRI